MDNIPLAFLKSLEIVHGNNLVVTIYHQDKKVYQNIIKFARSFADVNVGEPLVYVNSLVNIGVAVNQDSFSDLYHIGTGNDRRFIYLKHHQFNEFLCKE